jgi:hypothetical protein
MVPSELNDTNPGWFLPDTAARPLPRSRWPQRAATAAGGIPFRRLTPLPLHYASHRGRCRPLRYPVLEWIRAAPHGRACGRSLSPAPAPQSPVELMALREVRALVDTLDSGQHARVHQMEGIQKDEAAKLAPRGLAIREPETRHALAAWSPVSSQRPIPSLNPSCGPLTPNASSPLSNGGRKG